MSSEWKNIGTIRESKKGNLYIKIDADLNAKEGDTFMLKNKKKEILESAEKGYITEERAQELIENLSFIKYTIVKPPNKDM